MLLVKPEDSDVSSVCKSARDHDALMNHLPLSVLYKNLLLGLGHPDCRGE